MTQLLTDDSEACDWADVEHAALSSMTMSPVRNAQKGRLYAHPCTDLEQHT